MIRVFLAETRKLRRPVLFFGSMGAAGGFSALFTALLFLNLDSGHGNGREGQFINRAILEMPHGLSVGFSNSSGFLGLIALCIFASQTALEYTHGTLRNLLVRQPHRITLLVGKFFSMCLFALISVVLSLVVSVITSYSVAGKAKVVTTAWSTGEARSDLLRTFVNVLIFTIAYGIIGMILGLLLRSPISAISIGVAWLLIAENLLAATVKHSAKWMPGQMLNTIAQGGDVNASYVHSLWIVAMYLTLGTIAATVLFRRRDVSN